VLNAQSLPLGQPNPRAGWCILRRMLGIGVLPRAESSRKREGDKRKDKATYNAANRTARSKEMFSHGLGSLSATLSMKPNCRSKT
jgi:hypothetical protein